ncbi:type IV toxin-antitoxin system AbiEi family antitoxin domain-containing protein [Actinomycetospora cinnamomea]|uniref:Putative transcriptional regulator of viral defense system n=1 Tax=Actinomycetospora cinnamomea TaxID=663609 RepID=A0A2U1EUS0_9PSEU|nr:type IV toxin-antitoxin system AbiEi family antitoxin domain-containing protein [Actinomycetospora cinnamomea]PVZ03676.1 putative transcriptional regulator of viral defense system [Actinomycetospora cinnamomea]
MGLHPVDLATVLRRQHGVVTTRQARAAGVGPRARRARVARGEWERLAAGLYRALDRPAGPEARVWAAVLLAGEGATLCGAAAGWWWGLVATCPRTIRVAVDRARTVGASLEGLHVVRRDLGADEIVHRRGVPVVHLALAVLETAVEVGGEEGDRVLDRALQRRVDLAALRRAHARALGRRGSTAMGDLLVRAAGGAAFELERRAHAMLRTAGVADWRANARLVLPDRAVVADLVFDRERVVVELKGWAYHRTLEDLQADATRENALQLAGWTVLQFTWWDVVLRPGDCLARLRAARGRRLAA